MVTFKSLAGDIGCLKPIFMKDEFN